MERIKRCLNCGTNNTASYMFCERCGADISRLPIEFDSVEANASVSITSEPVIFNVQEKSFSATNLEYVKICRCCGKVSVSNASLCAGCGTELTSLDIISTEGKISTDYVNVLGESGHSKYSMTIVNGTRHLKTMKLSVGLSVFGRIHLDDFEDKLNFYQCISDIHCLILISDDTAEITDCSRNGTFLNNQRIIGKAPVGDGISVDICGRECLSLVFRSGRL